MRVVGSRFLRSALVLTLAVTAWLVVPPAQSSRAAVASCNGQGATIVGSGDDIWGTDGPDVIVGTGEGERIYGVDGNDTICGKGGADFLIGGAGDDYLNGGPGTDQFEGGAGADTIKAKDGEEDGVILCEDGVDLAPTRDVGLDPLAKDCEGEHFYQDSTKECPSLVIFGARGTGEDYYAGTVDGFGPEVSKAVDHMLSRVENYGTYTTEFVTYPATIFPWDNNWDWTGYSDSVRQGTDDLVQAVNERADACHDKPTRFAFVGFSQGSHVATLASVEMSDAAKGRLILIGLIADPQRHRISDPETPGPEENFRSTLGTEGGVFRDTSGLVTGPFAWLDEPRSKVASFCVHGDLICEWTPRKFHLSDIPASTQIHGEYYQGVFPSRPPALTPAPMPKLSEETLASRDAPALIGKRMWQQLKKHEFGIPPSIGTTSIPSAQVGKSYWTRVVTVDNRPGTWKATSLPPGLTMDPGSGSISGKPTVAGNWTPTVKFTDAMSKVAIASLSLRVTGGPGRIVFSSFRPELTGPDSGVFVMNSDGSSPTLLTTPGFSPTSSADGSKIAFTRYDGIHVVNSDGTGLTPLTNTTLVRDSSPAWSPDGTRVAFIRTDNDEDRSDVDVVNADGSGPLLTLSSAPDHSRPASDVSWAPDGSSVLFVREGRINVVSVNGSASATEFRGKFPSWSPDGSKIAYADPQSRLYVIRTRNLFEMDPPRTDLRADGTNSRPTWSPDGSKIAYARFDGTFVVNAAATPESPPPVRISKTVGSNPIWSRDGKKILLLGSDHGIYVVNANGSGQSRLTTTSDNSPTWLP